MCFPHLSTLFNAFKHFEQQNHRLLLHQYTQTTTTTATTSPKSDEGRHNKRVNLPTPLVSSTFSKTHLTEGTK
ncbi:hypothetical protein DVH24_006243 [Malus domestica]|uniref:Uncharacterized protein n=1 Tax=Malus domestica TaxID=3750 RepID=A0A498KCA4_MALDO|nr:hypothetical protein DVH24_006243 [Malus domestica]